MSKNRWTSIHDDEDDVVDRSDRHKSRKRHRHEQNHPQQPAQSNPEPEQPQTNLNPEPEQIHRGIYRLPQPPLIHPCTSVTIYQKLNRIQEGSYGIVYRARHSTTNQIYALKKLKFPDAQSTGFPLTTLREIHTLLMVSHHPNIVKLHEIVTTPSCSGVFLVMEYMDHDLKSVMDTMSSPFLVSEVKTLMMQLLDGVACLHRNWIIHRDLKPSNLLMNNRGRVKIADFGLARRVGSPIGAGGGDGLTELVVTLWYRAPELLMGAKTYSTAIDIWSVGCIFGELVNKAPMMPGRGEMDQLGKIFKLLGTPSPESWPSFATLPRSKTFNFRTIHHPTGLRSMFPYLPADGVELMQLMLKYDPDHRVSAEDALKHKFFKSSPLPKDPDLFPTFPSKASGDPIPQRNRSPVLNPTTTTSGLFDSGSAESNMSSAQEAASVLLGDDALYSASDSGIGFRLRI